MTPTTVASALGTRRTVRTTYSRSLDTYRVDVMRGDEVTLPIASGLDEDAAERRAWTTAMLFTLDRTSLDVD